VLLLFVILILAFAYTAIVHYSYSFEQHAFPKAFFVSLILLALSSVVLQKAFKAYRQEDESQLFKVLFLTLLLSFLFLAAQMYGWKELVETGIFFRGIPVGSYFYLLTGLHALHLVGGIVFLAIFTWQVRRLAYDAVKKLVYFTNPYELLKLQMLSYYWHAMGILWGILFVIFLVIFL
ncbi:MAG: cytochrome c oxidase subunit 3, partial [Flammeovirgaceae bacterium]|nr:cytochrome c oxidase subunit 3 [Flammeovirgaceae bacterium]